MNTTQNPSTWGTFENLGKPKRLLSTLAVAGGMALAVSVLPQNALAQTAGKKPNIRMSARRRCGRSKLADTNLKGDTR